MKIETFKTGDRILSIIWMILGILIVIESFNLDIGTFRNPGPGLMPLFLGVILFFITLAIFLNSLVNHKKKEIKNILLLERKNTLKIVVAILILLTYGFIIEIAGFLITAFFCFFLLLRITGRQKLGKDLFLTTIVVVAAYFLFVIALGVQLPPFPW